MLCRGAASDVSGRKERRNKNPGIVENAFRAQRVDRCRDICAGANPAEPTLLAPTREAFSGFGARNGKRFRHVGDVDYISRCGQNLSQLSATSGQPVFFDTHKFSQTENYNVLRIHIVIEMQ